MINFMNELRHLKSLEQSYIEQNGDLQRRIDNEGCHNEEMTCAIKELEAKIKQKETQITDMRKELDGARYNNNALVEKNSEMKVEIDSMTCHIKVVTHKNDELTREIDHYAHSNEVFRQQMVRNHGTGEHIANTK